MASLVDSATPGRAPKLVFSGLDSSVAGDIERAFAEAGHLVGSNSRNYRMEATVPLLIPEVNAEHLKLLEGAGLVERRVEGRTTICRLRPEPLEDVRSWVAFIEEFWTTRLDRLEKVLTEEDR